MGEAGDGENALRLIKDYRPDVALLDCRLPGFSGAEVAAKVQEQGLPTRVLALSAYAEDQYVHGMLQAGALGYLLLKDEPLETVVAAVQAVASGAEWYSQPVMARVVAWARGETLLPSGVGGLTRRELEVLCLLARGWDNRRIAGELKISDGTVKNHVARIYDRLGAHSRAEVVAWAWEHGVMKAR